MDFSRDQFFLVVLPFIIPLLVAGLRNLLGTPVWAKVNQPAMAALIGMVCGLFYSFNVVYVFLNRVPLPETATPLAFMVQGIMTGLGGAGVAALVKDIRTGTISATTKEDVLEIRAKQPSKDGIGA